MATNVVSIENEISFTGTTTARASGSVVLIGSAGNGIVAILKNGTGGGTAALKQEVACWKEGTFKGVAKRTDLAWAKGGKIWWNNSVSKFQASSTTGTRCGRAFAAATTTATIGIIQLVPQ